MKAVILIITLFLANSALAFQVEPMVQKLLVSGAQAQAEYRVENTSSEPLAVEAISLSRHVKQGTDEELMTADRDFIIMPPQATIAPGSFQLFRIRYLGTEVTDKTASYRIIFKQLPLKSNNEESGVDLLFHFSTLVFVSPTGVQPDVRSTINNDIIQFTNIGDGLADFNGAEITLHSDKEAQTLSWNEFGAYSPANFLVPNQSITIPIQPEWMKDKTITDISVSMP